MNNCGDTLYMYTVKLRLSPDKDADYSTNKNDRCID